MRPLRHKSQMRGACLLVCAGLIFAGCATKKPDPQAAAAQPRPSPARTQPNEPKIPLYFRITGWIAAPFQKLFPPKERPPQALPPRLVGTIKSINTEDGFVLIDTSTYSTADPGDVLICIMDRKQTASLRMSNLKAPPFLIADITNGTPSPGDRVYKP